jgi:hypothetical protein
VDDDHHSSDELPIYALTELPLGVPASHQAFSDTPLAVVLVDARFLDHHRHVIPWIGLSTRAPRKHRQMRFAETAHRLGFAVERRYFDRATLVPLGIERVEMHDESANRVVA